MNKFLFKSSETPDLQKLIRTLDMLLDEQRHQRGDLATIKRQLHTLISESNLQEQAQEYFRQKKLDEDLIDTVAEE